jgi:disulfide bond formation protein DsbB
MALAATGSAALMLAAFAFQHLGDMPPCKLCIWQRYGHVGAIAAGVAAVFAPLAAVALAGAGAVFSSAAIGAYHAGVERGWWKGPDSCAAQPVTGLSTEDAIAQIMNAPLVRCDEIPWQLLGLSMAGWNSVAALLLTALWLSALRAPRG